jgi:hypothetical protein
MAIWDACLVRDEILTLRLRLDELWPVVDHFVVVEASETFRGQPKSLLASEDLTAYAAKLEIVTVKLPAGDPWVREAYQRAAMTRGLVGGLPDDLVLVSDVDEIPRADVVARLAREMSPVGFLGLSQAVSYYAVNWRAAVPWIGTKALRHRLLRVMTPQQVRAATCSVVPDAGWHLRALAPPADRIATIQRIVASCCRAEYDQRLTPQYLKHCVSGFAWDLDVPLTAVAVDRSFPAPVQRGQYDSVLTSVLA